MQKAMIQKSDYSIKYASTPAATHANGNIVIPGGTSAALSQTANIGCQRNADAGVVITPDPSGIVIKTRLMAKQNHFSFGSDDSDSDDHYIPRSLSSIYAVSQSNAGGTKSPESSDNQGKDDTKVFLNICTHPLIAVPGQRKGLDEQTGKEIDGWRLPMALGDLRPCYDKTGNAVIVADCILNPGVVREMNSDSNHYQFVCDLVVQSASRKFGQAWLGGRELDRRFKLPKIKYVGYVDETTGIPIIPKGIESQSGLNRMSGQKAAVAKQRVKGDGGKSPIIEEVECSTGFDKKVSTSNTNNSTLKLLKCGQVDPKAEAVKTKIRIELFICNGDQTRTPLFDFLRMAAVQKGIVPQGQPSSTLRAIIKSPELKSCKENETLHESQRLKAPIAFRIASFDQTSAFPSLNGVKENEYKIGSELDCWSVVATCSIGSNKPLTNVDMPRVDLSAFLLILSTQESRTECILPFPVDTRKASTTYDPETGVVETCMPLLQKSLQIEDGPDPGTRPWELQNALGGDTSNSAAINDRTSTNDSALYNKKRPDGPSADTMYGSYFVADEIDDEDVDDLQPLPEDAFHSQDVVSRHLLQQQEEERRERVAKNDHGRDGADVEYINVDDFRRKHRTDESKEDDNSCTLEKAQRVMKDSLQNRGSSMCGDIVLGLV